MKNTHTLNLFALSSANAMYVCDRGCGSGASQIRPEHYRMQSILLLLKVLAVKRLLDFVRESTALKAAALLLPLALLSPQIQALSIYKDNAMGNLSLVSPPSGPEISSSPSGWNDVPGLSTAVYSRSGDNLEITVTAEVYGEGRVFFRALVDGGAASPDDVVYKSPGDFFDGVRSFTFIKKNLSKAKHLVQIQWFADPDTTARIGDRTLSADSAAPTWGTGRLAVVAAPSAADIVKSTPACEDIPNLATTLTTDAIRDFKMTFSAEADADVGRFFARALIDGQVVSDALFVDAGSWTQSGTRSFTFVQNAVPAGAHSVKMQWCADGPGAQIRIGDRTLTAFAAPASSLGGGLVATAVEGPPVEFMSPDWSDVPNMSGSFTTNEPSANVQVGFSAETSVHFERMFLRALIDGEPAQPEDVVFASNGSAWRAQSFAFTKKNVLPGTHSVRIQARVDESGLGYLADRSISVLFKRRHGLDFAQPYASLKPRQGKVPFLVICFDPLRPGETRPTSSQVVNQHRGDDGGWNVLGWYRENTGGRYIPGPFTFLGCNDGNWFLAPPDRQGTWYWDTGNFGLMWEDAIKAADPYFDFHQYDRNGDNRITGDELAVSILRPQNSPYGTHRAASAVTVDGISTPMTIDVLDVYFSANNDVRVWNVGTVAHEAAHGVLDAPDMYSNFTTRAGFYSLMDSHFNSTHLDPFLKLKSGYLTPDVVEINKWATRTVSLASVEKKREAIIIYDPNKKDREYFIIENRWRGTSPTSNYDFYLSPATPGIAVWHIVEDLALANQFRPSGDPGVVSWDWGRLGIRFLGVLPSNGSSKELKWADGSSSKIKVTAKSNIPALGADFVNLEIAKLP